MCLNMIPIEKQILTVNDNDTDETYQPLVICVKFHMADGYD